MLTHLKRLGHLMDKPLFSIIPKLPSGEDEDAMPTPHQQDRVLDRTISLGQAIFALITLVILIVGSFTSSRIQAAIADEQILELRAAQGRLQAQYDGLQSQNIAILQSVGRMEGSLTTLNQQLASVGDSPKKRP